MSTAMPRRTEHFFRETVSGLRRNGLVAFAAISTTFVALLLVGLAQPVTAGYDCGACGAPTCAEFAKTRTVVAKEMGYTGPHCVMRMIDIGVALASAAKAASLLSVDCRVQQRVGAAARALGIIQGEVVMGIPVSITGKSIYFDRSTPAKH